jgi:peptidyl-prolyl cis-trans isomerase SurA
MRLAGVLALIVSAAPSATILDRIAVVVNNQIVKDSDIDRDVRVTEFLNGVTLDLSAAARKEAASRLIDQTLIRREIEVAQYPGANPAETQQLLDLLRKQRYAEPGAYAAAMARYGITPEQLKRQVAWQATVLHFIEQRFRPGVLIPDEEVQKYFESHAAEFRQASGGKAVTIEEVRPRIEEQLSGERVNREFFNWLEQARKEAQIRYLETELK